MKELNSCVLCIVTFLIAFQQWICMAHSAYAGLKTTAGTSPLNVTDFSCVSYDYEYMECSFTIPENKLLTSFYLEYRLPKDSYVYHCNCHNGEKYKLICNVTDYLPMRDKYIFSLKGTNDVGKNVQTFLVHNHKNVIPSAVDIVQQNITSNSIALSLEKLKFSYYMKIGLTYDIQIRDNDSNWRTPHIKKLKCLNGTCNIVINKLYAFWLYWIKVRVKSNAVDNNNFWSKEKILQFETKSERPQRAPTLPVGSFYIGSTETQLRLYWEQIPEQEHNGPGFLYIVNKVNQYGIVMYSTKTKESSFEFTLKNENIHIFIIKSANDIGESTDGNEIRVYRAINSQYEVNENSIAKIYHNRSYTVSWYPPENMDLLINYTVFWCLPKIELPNQCKGQIFFKYLDKLSTNFTTKPNDRSLNLAISANYPFYNKGMQWARCTDDVSSELMQMELEANVLNESAIMVKWSSGSVCASILKGYNLTFCQASMDNKCITPSITVELLREKKEYRNHTICDLPPYTNVCLNIFMYTSSKQGRISDLNCVRTKASAPVAPKTIKYIRSTVTSKSAKIQWSAPDKTNGILSHYTIYWRRSQDNTFEKNTTPITQTSYNLTGLNSYSNYEVYVTAHTIKESLPSRKITFTTLIGIPSSPRNLQIYENESVLYWEQPDLPSGKHLLYVVALIRRDENFNSIYERVSIVKERSCRFQEPDCLNSNNSYALLVRAVNVGRKQDVDQEIVAMNKDGILAGAIIDERFCKEDKKKSFDIKAEPNFENKNDKFFFASPWTVAPRSYSCSKNSKASIYAVALIIVIVFAVYICYWLRNKISKMKNITVILPKGLDPNYKNQTNTWVNELQLEASTNKNIYSDTYRSKDCLVLCGLTENLNLLPNFHKESSNTLYISSSSRNQHNQQSAEHDSLGTTNEQLKPNYSLGFNLNFKYHDNLQIRRLSSDGTQIAVFCFKEEKFKNKSKIYIHNENIQNFCGQQNYGYSTHNSHISASI